MVTDTRDKILEMARVNGRVRPVEIMRALGFGQTAIQRHLKRLVKEGKLTRRGMSPKVFYEPTGINNLKVDKVVVSDQTDTKFIDDNYLYVTADGRMLRGWVGFVNWVDKIKENTRLEELAKEYKKNRLEANNLINTNGWIDASEKMKQTLGKVFVDELYYSDFYSLPKFGKTKLGQLMLYGKQSGNKELISEVVILVKETIKRLINVKDIQAVGFIPHSIARPVQFLHEMSRMLALTLPELKLEKAYGEIVVAQKTLSTLEEREENARKTIMVADMTRKYEGILLIDDALGSGATMNETARKLKETGVAKRVYGYAVVGSMKGFEVIREV